jgi:hypothetical protein
VKSGCNAAFSKAGDETDQRDGCRCNGCSATADRRRRRAKISVVVAKKGEAMAKVRDAYGNSAASGYTIDFFNLNAPGSSQSYLASPFFSTFDPIRVLTTQGCKVKLLVRLCSITPPTTLRQALNDPNVTVRYYTSRDFHAKLYIIDDEALVGSANLTHSGLMTNREVSVVLRKDRDPGFDALPSMFNLFWDYADVLTADILARYEQAFKKIGKAKEEEEFQAFLETLISPAVPPSAKVGSEIVSKRRSFLQGLRRKYDEEVIPAFREVGQVFEELGQRRAEFRDGDPEIELGRFLGWLRIARAPGDSWHTATLADLQERRKRITHFLGDWHAVEDTTAGDMFHADKEVGNIQRLRSAFASAQSIAGLNYDDLFEALISVHAFYDRLRFVSGGLVGLRLDFSQRNTLASIKETLCYLLYGSGTALERAYDCIYDEKRRLGGFGEACVMELLGWMDPDRPPINGRTIKALRFLGFDVKE